jgi:hypothetical protein
VPRHEDVGGGGGGIASRILFLDSVRIVSEESVV